jgi:hypothetical protein
LTTTTEEEWRREGRAETREEASRRLAGFLHGVDLLSCSGEVRTATRL